MSYVDKPGDLCSANHVTNHVITPGCLVEIINYAREEFMPAGSGLEEGLEIERV